MSLAVQLNLKGMQLGVRFEMEFLEGEKISENDPAPKAMKEAARQLGLTIEFEE